MSLFHKKYPNLSYDMDWDLLVFDNLPIKFRQVKIFKYLTVIINSIKTSYDRFITQRADYLRLQNVNGQTIVLAQSEYLFKPTETPQELDEVNLYDSTEFGTQPIERQTFLPSRAEVESGVDFIVYVPLTLLQTIRITQIEAVVEQYKIVGTIYKVEGY
jgi:hypothetical protein